MTYYKAASFFSGIGGLDLAFAWAGFDIRLHVEIDDYCRQVLHKNRQYWQNAKQLKDIRYVTKSQVGNVDVMFGGFPCQDISIAGKRAGITTDTRSGLWFEFLRLIRQVRPRVVVLENVSAIHVPTTDDNGNKQPAPGLIVTATLTEVGYDCVWLPIRASDIGAPHQRERWFCIAYKVDNPNGYRHGKSTTSKRLQNYRARRRAHEQRTQHPDTTRGAGEGVSKLAIPGSIRRHNGRYHRQKRHIQDHINRDASQAKSKRQRRLSRAGSVSQAVGQGPQRNMVNTECEGLEGENNDKPQSRNVARPARRYGRYKRAGTQSRLGGVTYGVSSRVLGLGDEHRGQYPARPNEPQYDYEPSRLTGRREHRVSRLKALGNAVVPQQAYPVAMAVKAFLDEAYDT